MTRNKKMVKTIKLAERAFASWITRTRKDTFVHNNVITDALNIGYTYVCTYTRGLGKFKFSYSNPRLYSK